MGADEIENTFICPYCCKRIKCEGFQVNLNDTGWGIYRHVYHEEHTSHAGETGRSISTHKDNFILHNPKHMKMVSADLLAQLDPKKIPCPRCRQKIYQAQTLLNEGLCIDLTNVVRICDHCFLKSQTQKNKKNESNFLAAHGEQDKYSKKYNKHWLTNMENELKKAISELRTQKKPRRTYSDIDIDLLNRDRSDPVIKCTVQEMFHSEVNLLDTNRPEKIQHSKKQLAVERAVNFTEKIETFQTLGSESSIKIDVEKQDRIDDHNKHSRLGPLPSNEEETKNERQRNVNENIYQEDKHYHEITEPLQYEETTKQKKKGEKMLKDYEKSIPSETEKVIDSELEEKTSFFFPESFQKPDTKLKRRRVSSSDLIKDTQEKIRIKAKEEEEKLIERLKLKSELEEKKKLAREEKERLIKDKRKIKEEGIIKTKSSDIPSKTERTDLLEQKGKMKESRVEEELKQKRESIKPKEHEKSTSEQKKDQIQKDAFEEEPEAKFAKTQSDKGKDKSTSLQRKGTIKNGEFGDLPEEKQETTPLKVKDKATSLEQKGKKKKGEFEEEPDKKRDTMQLKGKDISTSLEQRGKPKKGEFEDEPDKKRESTQPKGKDISTSLEQRGKSKKGEFEDETDKKRESTQPKRKDISTSLEQKGKPKKSEFEVESGEKRETKQSKGKDKSDLLEINDKLKKGGIEEAPKERQETTHAKKQDMSATLEDKNKMKIGALKKEPGEKQPPLQSKERDISDDPKKKESLKEKELKLTEVKLQKQSIDKLGAQLGKMKKNESGKDQTAIQSKKEEEINKLIENSKKISSKDDGPEEKRDALQMKLEKSNKKKEEMQEKDLKMTQVKLVKASTDDLGKLAKVNKKLPAGTLSKSKEPEISKMLLESAKRKESLVDKAPRFEGPKKKDNKSELVDTKETKEREVKMNQVKMVERSYDDIILKLIRIKSGKKIPTVDDHPPSNKITSVKRSVRAKKKKAREGESNLTEEESSVEYKNMEEFSHTKKGKTPQFQPPHRDGQDIVPIYIKHELSEMGIAVPLENVDDAILAVEDRKKVDPEATKGVIRYALSDRTFIEKGWTMLPVEKVVRKMNIYRMRPAQPEFDWFEHNKHKGLMLYDTGTKLAEFDKNGRGRWFYQNGRLALDYYEAEETNTQQRFVVYSNGEQDERGRSRPVTILATFDHLGNGVVFDHAGKIRLKYNQTEGVLLDRSIGPASNWKWHTLNDPPVLQQVMIDTQMPLKDPKILKMGGPADNRTRPDNEEMLAIEFDNFIKEKSKKLTQKFKPFQIRMKALKINENFSLKVLDQATIYLIFRDGSANLKVNIGMILDHKEIVDTDTAELGEVSNSLERLPARTDSLAALQRSVAHARRFERIRTERERRLRHPEPCLSADELGKAASRPLKPPLRTLPTSPKGSIEQCKCSRKQSSSLYYSNQLL